MTRICLTITLGCLLTTPLAAQTTTPTMGKNSPTTDATSSIAGLLRSDGLAGVLKDGDFARALGLDEDQFFEAQYIIDAYQALIQMWMMLDPELQKPETLQALVMIRFMLDWELYTLLDDDQQQLLEKWFAQHQGTTTEPSTAPTTQPTSK